MDYPDWRTPARIERHMKAAHQLRADTVARGLVRIIESARILAARVGDRLRGAQGLVRFDVQRLTGPHSRTPRV